MRPTKNDAENRDLYHNKVTSFFWSVFNKYRKVSPEAHVTPKDTIPQLHQGKGKGNGKIVPTTTPSPPAAKNSLNPSDDEAWRERVLQWMHQHAASKKTTTKYGDPAIEENPLPYKKPPTR